MGGCDSGCVHSLIHSQLATRRNGSPTASTPPVSQLFGPDNPVWRQKCSCNAVPQRSPTLLSELMGAAARLGPSSDLAAMWASELPMVAAEGCRAHEEYARDECNGVGGTDQILRLAEARAIPYLNRAQGCNGKRQGAAVLRWDESGHLLLHLLDLSLANGVITHGAVVDSVCDAASVLVRGRCNATNDDDDDGTLWVAIINMCGAVVARHMADAGDRSAPTAVALARIVVFRLNDLSSAGQWAALALVYTIVDKLGACADACIVDLVTKCAFDCKPPVKHAAGQMLAKLYENGGMVPRATEGGLLRLAGDYNHRVRAVWSRLAGQVTIQATLRPIHPFVALQRRLCGDGEQVDSGTLGLGHGDNRMSLADAMLVAEAVCDSVSAHAPGQPELDCGLSPAALRVIEATHCGMGLGSASHGDIYAAINTVVAASACCIGLADSSGGGGLSLVVLLIDAVKAHLERHPRSETSTVANELYWALELIFHLCKPGLPGAAVLCQDTGTHLVLLSAAVACNNAALAVFIAQLAAMSSAPSARGKSYAGAVRRLAHAIPWPDIDQAACCGAGDAVDELVGGCFESIGAAGGSSIAEATAASKSRLGVYDDRVASAGGFGGLRYSHLLFDDRANAGRVGDYERAALGLRVRRVAGTAIASRFQRWGPLRIAAGVVTPLPSGPLAQLSSAVTEEHFPWSGLTDMQRMACVEACLLSGHASPRLAAAALNDIASGQLDPRDAALWRTARAASIVAGAYEARETAAMTPADSAASALAALAISNTAPTDSCDDVYFALPAPHPSILFGGDMGVPSQPDVGATSGCRPDPTVAREALLYYFAGMGPEVATGESMDELFTRVLLDGHGKIRFTATGTFDSASCLIARMTTRPLDAPKLLTSTLTASAVCQLAPYVPQLLAMLSCRGDTADGKKSNTACGSAYSILELLATYAPDTVAFHVVVASRSHSQPSAGQQLAAKLLEMLPAKQVADICVFLECVSSIAVLPQEQLRLVCMRARSAHTKAVSMNQQRLESASAGSGVAAALDEALRQPMRILDEHRCSNALPSPAERDFAACIPKLRALLDQLRSPDILQASTTATTRTADSLWAEVFQLLATSPTLSLDYVCPTLAEFSAPVPIPMLTDPAVPLYFVKANRSVRVIGSKTRPKQVSLQLRTCSGEAVESQYIVKGNEDIRIDESVMQTFIRLNRVASNTFAASDDDDGRETPRRADMRQSSLAVYNVVPTDSCGGLIQVVDNSLSLFSVYSQYAVANSAPRKMPAAGAPNMASKQRPASGDRAPIQPAGLHQAFMHHARDILRDANIPDTTPSAEWPSAVIERVYDSLCRTAPPDLLYVRLAQAAQHSAHLYRLSRSMARSIGMVSVAGYLLGLGDRHLDNLLLDVRHGQLVQVDFNVSYDFGGVSNIPEQVPFRMTPNLSYVCGNPDHIDMLRGKTEAGSGGAAQQPFAMSRVFLGAATATLQFARMDCSALVDGIVSRACSQPFAEWRWIEESWLRDREQSRLRYNRTQALLVQPPPQRLPSAVLDVWNNPQSVSVDEFVRRTGLNPPNAFWPQGTGPGDPTGTEALYGWRLARGAVSRVRARLRVGGTPGQTPDDIVESQVMLLWEVAMSKSRLARMYTGWAPWI